MQYYNTTRPVGTPNTCRKRERVVATIWREMRAQVNTMATARWCASLDVSRASEHDTFQTVFQLSCGGCAPIRVPPQALTAERGKFSRRSRARSRCARVVTPGHGRTGGLPNLTPPSPPQGIKGRKWRYGTSWHSAS